MNYVADLKYPRSSKIIFHASRVLDSTPRKWLISALLLAQVLIHGPFLQIPPAGIHLWRQTQTLSVARNFSEEGMNPFSPRVDSRGAGDGVTGMEFPLINFVIATGYLTFGFSHVTSRVVLLVFSLAAVAACFRLLELRFVSRSIATVGTTFLICSPLFGYYSITAVPEVAALALILTSLGLVEEPDALQSRYRFPFSLVILAISGLVKITALIVLPIIVFRIWVNTSDTKSRMIRLGGVAAALGVVGAWYLYARWLSVSASNYDFKLRSAFPYPLQVTPKLLKIVFLQWLPEFYITYGTFIFFLVGVVVLLRGQAACSRVWEGLYATGALILIIAELPMLDVHDYYLIPVLPLLVIIAAHGWRRLAQPEMPGWVHIVALLLITATIVFGPVRGLNRFVRDPPRPDLLAIERCLDKVIPDRSSRVIAASDRSPSIYLYFMHRKGWSTIDGVSPEFFGQMVREGALYLVSDSRALETRPEIKAYLKPSLAQCGSFLVFPISPEKTYRGPRAPAASGRPASIDAATLGIGCAGVAAPC